MMLQKRESESGVVWYASALLEAAGVRHAFSTRLGGVSEGAFASLNLGNPGGAGVRDEETRIQENYQRLQAAMGVADRERCWVHQVHGHRVLTVRQGAEFENGQPADALVCDDPQRVVAVRVADCVPILLASDDGRVVAAVHAGWRGVVGGVVGAAIDAMRREFGVPSARLLAAIGPCIGPEAFEVGAEVAEEFIRVFGECRADPAAGGGQGPDRSPGGSASTVAGRGDSGRSDRRDGSLHVSGCGGVLLASAGQRRDRADGGGGGGSTGSAGEG